MSSKGGDRMALPQFGGWMTSVNTSKGRRSVFYRHISRVGLSGHTDGFDVGHETTNQRCLQAFPRRWKDYA